MGAIHAQIRKDAALANAHAVQSGPVPGSAFSAALQGLIDSASDALCEALPASFEHHGQTYRLMVDIQRARLAIFESMTAETSLLVLALPDEQGGK